jgi:hypothetical protein
MNSCARRWLALLTVLFGLLLTPALRAVAQSDPRVPIPAAGQPAPPFEITSPGSYYLSGDRRASGDGIRVNADDVTIDLMGFTLAGPDSGSSVGITMNGRRNVEIRHGTIRSFGGRGIHDRNEPGTAWGKRILDVRVIANGRCGICLGGDGNLVRDCLVADNKGTGACCGGLLEGNVFLNNATGGIACGDGALVLGNTIAKGGGAGIFARSSCRIRDNLVSDSQNSGIYTEYGSLVEGNVVTNANRSGVIGYAGIKVIGDCIVRGNTARSSRMDNLLVLRSGNVVEGNLVTAAVDTLGDGITFGMKENYYAGNRVSGTRADFTGELPTGLFDGGGNTSLPHREPPVIKPAEPEK